MLLWFLRKQGPVARNDPFSVGKADRRKPVGPLRGWGQRGQATKGVWGMPWHQEAMKGVEDCDKPGGSVKRDLIPGSLNDPGVNP